jgi:chemotaxis protein histidine kinase CheA
MTSDSHDPLLHVRREFTRGLPERLEKIRNGLTQLIEGFSDTAAEQFHVASHALVGMAATFDAHDMAEHARVLAGLGRRWRGESAAAPAELDQAKKNVELLEGSIHDFIRQVEGDLRPSDSEGIG